MITRRKFCASLLASVPLLATPTVSKANECAVFTDERQRDTTPTEALNRLKQGNDRFVAGQSINCDLLRQVKETAISQSPYAAIVGCIDSRVPPEIVFDQRIGDVFCARVAGNFVNDDILGSLEYATEVAGAKAIIILGHSSCGAIKSAVDDVKMGHITNMLTHIQPAIEKLDKSDGKRSSDNTKLVQKVAEQNAHITAVSLIERSPILMKRHQTGHLIIAPAMHDVRTGKVTWL